MDVLQEGTPCEPVRLWIYGHLRSPINQSRARQGAACGKVMEYCCIDQPVQSTATLATLIAST